MTEKMMRALIALWSLQNKQPGSFFPEDVSMEASMLGEECGAVSATTSLGDLHRMSFVKKGADPGSYVLSYKGERVMEIVRKMFERVMGDYVSDQHAESPHVRGE